MKIKYIRNDIHATHMGTGSGYEPMRVLNIEMEGKREDIEILLAKIDKEVFKEVK